jgi:2-polyprenyl-3-methyl-5-hydroxy-6-metoxy-1,4-benzoquinol methylase
LNLFDYLEHHPEINSETLAPKRVTTLNVLPEEHWDTDWRHFRAMNLDEFYNALHNILSNEIERVAIEWYRAGKTKLKILDLPCGQHPLLITLLKSHKLFQIGFTSIHFMMVDRSQHAINLCKSKSMKLPTGVTTHYETKAAEDFKCDGYDIIISCGGLLHGGIAKSLYQAKDQLKKYVQGLNPGGCLITSGLTNIYISSSTMKKAGLEVIVNNCKGMPKRRNIYVAKKPFLPEKPLLKNKKSASRLFSSTVRTITSNLLSNSRSSSSSSSSLLSLNRFASSLSSTHNLLPKRDKNKIDGSYCTLYSSGITSLNLHRFGIYRKKLPGDISLTCNYSQNDGKNRNLSASR